MRILTLTGLYPNREMPRQGIFVKERLRHLLDSGRVDATVVAPVPWFPSRARWFGRYAQYARVPRYERQGEIDVHHPRFVAIPRIGNAFAPPSYVWSVDRCLDRIADRDAIDLVDAHYAFPDGVSAVRIARRLRKPIVLTVRGSDINVHARERAAGWWIRSTLLACDAVIAVSAALRDAVLAIEPRLEGRVFAVPNGVDQSRFRILPNRDAIRAALRVSGQVILSVGNLVPLKRHDRVIEALVQLPSATLIVVGEGPEANALQRIVREVGVADRVRFLPNVPQTELAELYNAADALVLASSSEGMPNVLLEALSCGTRIVATRVGGIPEIVKSAAAGVLIDDTRPETIAGAITSVAAVSERSRDAARAAVAEFDWARTTAAVLGIFDDVLARFDARNAAPAEAR